MATHLVNFSMHGDELQKAYEQVLDPSSPSNWALFGYFRNSSDLCVQATGSGGLQELADEFDDSKIQYAFVRIKEPRSQLLKCVFISWCGEGVPAGKKSMLAMHLQDVKNRFRGAHVEISARTELDVDPSAIMKKVLDSSGSKYNSSAQPVSSIVSSATKSSVVYQSTAPSSSSKTADIVRNQRNFASSDSSTLTKPVGEPFDKFGTQSASETRTTQNNSSNAPNNMLSVQESTKAARNLWLKREETESPRSRNQDSAVSPNIPVEPIKAAANNPKSQISTALNQIPSNIQTTIYAASDNTPTTIAEVSELYSPPSSTSTEGNKFDNKLPTVVSKDPLSSTHHTNNTLPTARALYDYTAAEDNELSFKAGDLIHEIVKIDEGWWQGVVLDQNTGTPMRYGLFPGNYVELITSSLEKHEVLSVSNNSDDTGFAPVRQPRESGEFQARVLYDYEATEENEISIRVNEIITNIQPVTDDWWRYISDIVDLSIMPQNDATMNSTNNNSNTKMRISLLLLLFSIFVDFAFSQTVVTLAGNNKGFTDAGFMIATGIAVGPRGNVFVSDTGNNGILKIFRNGTITTLVERDTTTTYDKATGAEGEFCYPKKIAVGPKGNVFVADTCGHRIRKISPTGIVSTLAGSGSIGSADGYGENAKFNYPTGVAVDSEGYVFVADTENCLIRVITPNGQVTTLAGSGAAGFLDGMGVNARFRFPTGIAVDTSGNVFVADSDNHKIRKITPTGSVTTVAGSSWGSLDAVGSNAQFKVPTEIAVDKNGMLYVADPENNRIRKITPDGSVSTLISINFVNANSGVVCKSNGIAVGPKGNVFVADECNNKILKLLLEDKN